MKGYRLQQHGTYSIIAQDPETGAFGVAVQTGTIAVGAIVPWLEAGVGAIATQATANIRYGPIGLSLLREGLPAQKVVDSLVAGDELAQARQVAVIDSHGVAAAWTGDHCIPEASHHIGEAYAVQANMMVRSSVVPSMAQAFERAKGALADRMMVALKAAEREGGDIRGMQSAALKVGRGTQPFLEDQPSLYGVLDVRVDDHQKPLEELERVLRLESAFLLDYEGNAAFEAGEQVKAVELWRKARETAPELAELPFWQGILMADEPADIPYAVELIAPILNKLANRDHWLELIRRLEGCGEIKRVGASKELVDALQKEWRSMES